MHEQKTMTTPRLLPHPKFDEGVLQPLVKEPFSYEKPFSSVGHQPGYFYATDVPLPKDVHRLAMYSKLAYENAETNSPSKPIPTSSCLETYHWKKPDEALQKGQTLSKGTNEGFADVYKGDGQNPTIVAFIGTDSKGDALTDVDLRRACLNESSTNGISLKFPSDYLKPEEMEYLETQGRRLPYDKTQKHEQPSMACSTSVCSCSKVHQGFIIQYLQSREDILDLVRQTTGPVEVTGHSLGAALATICAVDIQEHLGRDVKCITFASPRVGNDSFGERYRNSVADGSLRITTRLDTVPRLPAGLRFTHVTDEVVLGIAYHRNPITIWAGFMFNSMFGTSPHSLTNYLSQLKELAN